MESREPIHAHPIGEMIVTLFETGGRGEEPLVLRSQALEVIERAIDEYARTGSVELMVAAQTMFALADRLEEKNCPRTAAILCEVLDRPHVLGAMYMINERARNELGTVEHGTPGDEFASFASNDTGRRAPAFEESAPDDAVKLGSLSFPKRL
jgi:hypothetical protein